MDSLGLKYLQRNEFQTKKIKLLLKEFQILYSFDERICKKCGIRQGKPNEEYGIKKYYCKHTIKKVNKKIKKEKEELIGEVLNFIISP